MQVQPGAGTFKGAGKTEAFVKIMNRADALLGLSNNPKAAQASHRAPRETNIEGKRSSPYKAGQKQEEKERGVTYAIGRFKTEPSGATQSLRTS